MMPVENASVDPSTIWAGSHRPRNRPAPVWRLGQDSGLHDIVVRQGRPLLLVARNSDPARTGYAAAAADAHDAAIDLARLTGFDVTGTLPPRDQLAAWLLASPNVHTFAEDTGGSFSLRNCLIDLTEHGILLCLSAGSAFKLTDDHAQPHVDLVKRVLRHSDCDLAGVFVKRFDRLSRSPSAGVLNDLRAIERKFGSTWSGDGEIGRWDLGEMAEVFATIKGVGGRAESLAMRRKAAAGVRRETHSRMEEGRVRFAVAGSALPGLMRYRDRASNRSVLAIDSPHFYPDEHSAIDGVPDVRGPNGELVDQAATVQWALANYGVDGRDDWDLLDELLERRYSTDALRRRRNQGPSAYWGGPMKPVDRWWPARWFETIAKNLDLYETGRLDWHIPGDPNERHSIEGVVPASGSWATAGDFERIRAFLRQKAVNPQPRSTLYSYAGVRARLDGVPVVLVPALDRGSKGEFLWTLSVPGSRPRPRSLPIPGPATAPPVPVPVPVNCRRVPDTVLTAALIEALVACNGQPLREFAEDQTTQGRLARLKSERTKVGFDHDTISRQQDAQFKLIMRVEPNGDPKMPEALRSRAYAEWQRGETARESSLKELDRLDREISTLSGRFAGVPAVSMQAMVNGLRDPSSGEHRAILRDALRNLVFTSEPFVDGGVSGTRLKFNAQLVFATSSGPRAVDVNGSHDLGPGAVAGERRLQALTLLRAGHVAVKGHNGWVGGVSPHEIRRVLRAASPASAVSTCGDSSLLRLGMAVHFPDPFDEENPASIPHLSDLLADETLVAEFGDVATLAENIRNSYGRNRYHGWRRTNGGESVTRFLIAEALCEPEGLLLEERPAADRLRVVLRRSDAVTQWIWRTRAFRPRPQPCQHCGGNALAALLIPEPFGYVCLAADCRRDRSGVRWPTRFDQYISYASMWTAAGFDLDLPDPREALTPLLGRALLPRSRDRTGEDLERIIEAYLDRSVSVREVRHRLGINHNTLYRILRATDTPLRRRR